MLSWPGSLSASASARQGPDPEDVGRICADRLSGKPRVSRDIQKAPPAGLEPAPPAPEAGALSAELRGQEQGTIVLVPTVMPSRARSEPAVSCLTMPAEDAVATDPVEWKLLPRTAAVGEDGHLRVGDIDLLDLAAEFGTPLFVYDEYHLRQACRAAVAAWGDGVAYAAKAFLCRAMARLAHEEGMHLDVASGGELHVALSAGVPAAKLILHGNNKSEEELATALEAGVGRIVVDSFDEIARLGRLLDAPSGRSERPAVLVRVTPGVEAHTHEFVRTGGEDSKFGFSVASGAAAQAVAALELLPSVELVGVHAHIGSQVFDVSSFEQAAEVLGRFFAPLGLPELVVGGGLGVPYVNGESAPTQAEWAAATRSRVRPDGRRSVGADHG